MTISETCTTFGIDGMRPSREALWRTDFRIGLSSCNEKASGSGSSYDDDDGDEDE